MFLNPETKQARNRLLNQLTANITQKARLSYEYKKAGKFTVHRNTSANKKIKDINKC